ncbi:rhomboid family intramembrane serine protease [Candidatus Pacearchaeota archaeon]|nr:rhomboid family intramembrane serine protease [Candidatus Pacearchaeota archaeon]
MVYRRDYRRNPTSTFIRKTFSLTTTIIIVNVVLFFLISIISIFYKDLINFIAVKSSSVLSGENVWTIFTSILMHGSFFHLFVNMLSLFFLGGLTEQIIGRKRFFWFYLIAGIVGSLFFVLFAYLGQFFPRGDFIFGGIDDYAVGASGAIFGILGILATLLPKKKVYLIIGPLIVIILQVLIAGVLPSISNIVDIIGGILIFVMIFAMFSPSAALSRRFAMPLRLPFWLTPIIAIVPLLIIGFFVKLPIGNMAHFGGLVVGLVYGAYLRNKYKQKVKLLNRVIKNG